MTDGAGDEPSRSGFPRDVLAGDTPAAARSLLGARLVREPTGEGGAEPAERERRVGRIVEVEAYLGEPDRASHARMGLTPRNRVMFGPPGIAYVYLVYGMHHCLNVVTEAPQRPAAVLIRAVEPLAGVAAMRRARGRRAGRPVDVADDLLAAGPGLLAAAFDLDRRDTGIDLCDPASPIHLEPAPPGEAPPEVEATPRIGVAYAGEPWAGAPLRFIVPGSPSLSGLRSRRRGRVAEAP